MKKKIFLSLLVIICLFIIIGCGISNKEYYCEKEEHELVGNKCIEKVKRSMQKRYYCDDGRIPYGSGTKWCDTFTLAKEEYYCSTGYEEGLECVVSERTYDALVK